MPKVENPLTGRKTELTNWKSIAGLVGGTILLAGIIVGGLWIFGKLRGVVGAPQSGSSLDDVLGGI